MKSSIQYQSYFQLPDLFKSDQNTAKNLEVLPTNTNNELTQPPRPSSSLLHPDDVLEDLLSTSWNQNVDENVSDKRPLHCEICGKTFDKIMRYYGHLRVHSKDNIWSCDEFPNLKFPTKLKLHKHKVKNDPPLRSVSCMYCPMAFDSQSRLKNHFLAKHFNYRPHECDKCGICFLKPSDLKIHQQLHTGENKYPCFYCNMRFKDKSNLNRHVLTHTGEKPYVCVVCGFRYKQLASLKRHNKKCIPNKSSNDGVQKHKTSTSTVRQNYCRICGKTFQYKSALFQHSVRYHSPTTKPIDEDIESRTDDKTDTLENSMTVDEDFSNINPSTNDSEQLMVALDETTKEQQTENNDNNMLPVEFLKEMNNLQYLDDNELFCNDNDIDFGLNSHDYDYVNVDENNAGIFFDFSDINKSMDQDIMNALFQAKTKDLPDDLLSTTDNNLKETESTKINANSEPTVSVNECATIFEKDVDLEESSKLAANLNQLIGENNVQYICTEDDDTFIISLESHIDAERLTDILNIGLDDKNKTETDVNGSSTLKLNMAGTKYHDKMHKKECLNQDKKEYNSNNMNHKEDYRKEYIPEITAKSHLINFNKELQKESADDEFKSDLKRNTKKYSLELQKTNITHKYEQQNNNNTIELVKELNNNKAINKNETDFGNKIIKNEKVEVTKDGSKTFKTYLQKNDIELKKGDNNKKHKDIIKTKLIIEEGYETQEQKTDCKKGLPISRLPEKKLVVKESLEYLSQALFICKVCKKRFIKKDNYRSHIATHEPSLRRHVCEVCHKRFSYKSTLNKHVKKLHTPSLTPAHNCSMCDKTYKAAWLLRNHIERDHQKLAPHACDYEGCDKRFYMKFDLVIHKRYHLGERPYSCELCGARFPHASHRARHIATATCTKEKNKILMYKNLSEISKIKPERII